MIPPGARAAQKLTSALQQSQHRLSSPISVGTISPGRASRFQPSSLAHSTRKNFDATLPPCAANHVRRPGRGPACNRLPCRKFHRVDHRHCRRSRPARSGGSDRRASQPSTQAWSAARSSITPGAYNFVLLPPGNYDLTVHMTGFRDAALNGIQLDVDQVRRADLTLRAAPVTLEGLGYRESSRWSRPRLRAVGKVVPRKPRLESSSERAQLPDVLPCSCRAHILRSPARRRRRWGRDRSA